MAIGNLDRCITIQDFTRSQNEYGETTEAWTDTTSTRAGVKYKSGGESVFSNKETATADVIFTIRYRATLTVKSRIVFEGVNYDILHIAQTGRRHYQEVTAKMVQ